MPLQIWLSLWTLAWLSMMEGTRPGSAVEEEDGWIKLCFMIFVQNQDEDVVMLALWYQRSQQWPKTFQGSQEKLFAFLKISQYLLKRLAEKHYHHVLKLFMFAMDELKCVWYHCCGFLNKICQS